MCRVHELIPAARRGTRQRDDDVAIHQPGDEKRTQPRRIIAADGERVAGSDPALRQLVAPALRRLAELVVRPALVVPDQRRAIGPAAEALEDPAVFIRNHRGHRGRNWLAGPEARSGVPCHADGRYGHRPLTGGGTGAWTS